MFRSPFVFIVFGLTAVACCASVGLATAYADGSPKTTQAANHAAVVDVPKFELDIMPILSAAGCNGGGCHGKQRGQNGFALSLLGFDADFDYAAIVENARGRRVVTNAPDHSLLLQKGTGEVSHGGGRRLEPGGRNYETLRRWIAAGQPRNTSDDPRLVRVDVDPREALLAPKSTRQLRVTAHYSNGSTRDVTELTTYQSNDTAVTAVDAKGLVTAGTLPGETAVMARYDNHIAVFQSAVPQTGNVDKAFYAKLPRNNFVDDLVWKRLERLGITPSEPIDDATYLRRAHLDVIGRLPTPEEVRKFLADTSPNKRAALVDALLERPEYADHWANKWADLLRPNPYRVGQKPTIAFDQWIRDSFRQNKPYDEFVREIITARGSIFHNGATVLYRDRRSPDEVTTMVCQLFLGVRLDCARCHHHPFEVWGQDEFYGTAAYFSAVGYKGTGIGPPISGGEEFIFAGTKKPVKHPVTGADMPPKPLTDAAPEPKEDDLRAAFFEWMRGDKNPYFAQVAVNRLWNDVMGRGMVDPVDDIRATNPPSNPELLEALAQEFRRIGFDQKQLLRTILASQVYALSAMPNERNANDLKNYSRHYRQQLRAETLLDAVCDATEVREKFGAMPPESRAVELWTHRISSLFLDSFGRPDLNQDPPCERLAEATLVQAMHLMNAPQLHAKVTSDAGRVARLVKQHAAPEAIVDELYLVTYSRLPTDDERRAAVDLFSADESKHRGTAEDLLWALMNTPEFLFKN
jgi:hypothetical protein